MVERDILERIKDGTIKTNFLDFPAWIGEFRRLPIYVIDGVIKAKVLYAKYQRGFDIGYVTIEDIQAGRLQVRKGKLMKTLQGEVMGPSEEIW